MPTLEHIFADKFGGYIALDFHSALHVLRPERKFGRTKAAWEFETMCDLVGGNLVRGKSNTIWPNRPGKGVNQRYNLNLNNILTSQTVSAHSSPCPNDK